MKSIASFILSAIVFLASFQNSLLSIDYVLNRDYYEALCVNKAKPQMSCHGKCELQKQAENTKQQTELVKLSLEFNILPQKPIELPENNIADVRFHSVIIGYSDGHVLEGYFQILPDPPQTLS